MKLVERYLELNSFYKHKINLKDEYDSKISHIAKYIKQELSTFGYSESELADMLTKFLYTRKNATGKDILWFAYGRYLVKNLKEHITLPFKLREVQCIDCMDWFYGYSTTEVRCPLCQKRHENLIKKEWQRVRKAEEKKLGRKIEVRQKKRKIRDPRY